MIGKRENRRSQNSVPLSLFFSFLDFLVESVASDNAKGHRKKGKRERRWDWGLTLAPVASLALISDEPNNRKPQLQRKKRERKREEVQGSEWEGRRVYIGDFLGFIWP